MIIRTGLLFIPEIDDEASQEIRQLLKEAIPNSFIMLENHTHSQRYWIEELLRRWCDEEELDLVLTIGGTLPAPGPSQKEIVPEATATVLERLLPGISETMRAEASEEVALALLDRGISGIRGRTLLINLPAGLVAASFFLQAIIDLIEPIIKHLQEQPSAPTLTPLLLVGSKEESNVFIEQTVSTVKGLNSDDFAAFLQRQTRAKSESRQDD